MSRACDLCILLLCSAAFVSAGALGVHADAATGLSSAPLRYSGYEHQLSDVGEVTEEESEAESHAPPRVAVEAASSLAGLPHLGASSKEALRNAVISARTEQEAEWDELIAMMSALRQEQRAQYDALLAALR
jgi:hypothetical protein